jgi:hypothetical protein
MVTLWTMSTGRSDVGAMGDSVKYVWDSLSDCMKLQLRETAAGRSWYSNGGTMNALIRRGLIDDKQLLTERGQGVIDWGLAQTVR